MTHTKTIENDDIIRQLADEAATANGSLSPEDADQLRKWQMEESLSTRDAAKTTLGHVAAESSVQTPMVVHSGYDKNGRRA